MSTNGTPIENKDAGRTIILGAGTEVKIETKAGRVRITIEIDEERVAKAAIPTLLGAFMSGGASDEKKGGGRPKGSKNKSTEGVNNPLVPPLPFEEPVAPNKFDDPAERADKLRVAAGKA